LKWSGRNAINEKSEVNTSGSTEDYTDDITECGLEQMITFSHGDPRKKLGILAGT